MSQRVFSPEEYFLPDSPRCPVCGTPANVYRRKDGRFWDGRCDTCGPVWITPDAADYARNAGRAHFLSAWLRRRPDQEKPEFLAIREVEQILEDAPSFSVLDKLDLTLRVVGEKTAVPGQASNFRYASDFPLVYAANGDEALYYLRELGELQYINYETGIARLTAKGYLRLNALQHTATFSNTGFVAMSFAPELRKVYEQAIEPAVSEAAYRPLIMLRHEHVKRIDDEIIALIRQARFMVADVTGQNPGVYFEAGLMQGLGRHVFWMCNEAEKGELHFDTRQYNHILYSDLETAKLRLCRRILAVEGKGRGADVS